MPIVQTTRGRLFATSKRTNFCGTTGSLIANPKFRSGTVASEKSTRSDLMDEGIALALIRYEIEQVRSDCMIQTMQGQAGEGITSRKATMMISLALSAGVFKLYHPQSTKVHFHQYSFLTTVLSFSSLRFAIPALGRFFAYGYNRIAWIERVMHPWLNQTGAKQKDCFPNMRYTWRTLQI